MSSWGVIGCRAEPGSPWTSARGPLTTSSWSALCATLEREGLSFLAAQRVLRHQAGGNGRGGFRALGGGGGGGRIPEEVAASVVIPNCLPPPKEGPRVLHLMLDFADLSGRHSPQMRSEIPITARSNDLWGHPVGNNQDAALTALLTSSARRSVPTYHLCPDLTPSCLALDLEPLEGKMLGGNGSELNKHPWKQQMIPGLFLVLVVA
ncbi:uncharacterized protein LOC122486532 [Prionailurus bengalensis]|uniref:uncharacterized protein LOC122486532 n=1 Tax=Prionailurus bengalensis TaxID=37029 RepID=UPI001CA9D6CA|nr:uncharacterized protein LOC122486532 [Prionailurus bengalensis]